MPATLQGAKRADMFRFEGEEINNLAESPQLVRWEGGGDIGGVDLAHVDYLAADIAQHGQQAPVLVRRRADGRPELIAGRHRKAAIVKINADPGAYGLPGPIPLAAVYKDLNDVEAIGASFAENTGKPLTCMDLAHTAAQLARVMDWSNARIAALLSTPHHPCSPSRVSQLRSLIRLPMRLQRMLHSGAVPESVARAMFRLGVDAEEMEQLSRELEAGALKGSEITSRANAERRAAGKKVKRTIVDLRNKLAELGTAPSLDLLSWLDGDICSDERVAEIFAEPLT